MIASNHPTQESRLLRDLKKELAAALENDRLKLPVLPRIAGEVLTLTSNPDAEVSDLSDLLHRDQTLAGNVLRIANTAAYITSESIVSLKQAVMHLGMNRLAEIAIAACLQNRAFQTPGYEELRRQFLRHAFLAAIWGKEVARFRRRNVEGMFLCGLLFSVGKPIVLQVASELQKTRTQRLSASEMLQLVEEFCQPVGIRVTVEWKLPHVVQAATRHHVDYAAADEYPDEASMTHLADLLAMWITTTESESTATEPDILQDAVFAHLGIYPDEAEDLLQRRENVAAAASALQL